MKNTEIGCIEILESIKGLITIANFMGYIKQKDGEDFRQYGIISVTGGHYNATMLPEFADRRFKPGICYDGE